MTDIGPTAEPRNIGIEELLRLITPSDQTTITEQDIDADHDGYFDISPEWINRFTPSEYYSLQGTFRNRQWITSERSEEDYHALKTAYDSLKQIGISDDDCHILLEQVDKQYRGSLSDALRALLVIVAKSPQSNPNVILEFHKALCDRSLTEDSVPVLDVVHLDALLDMFSYSQVDLATEANEFIAVAHVVRSSCGSRLKPLFAVLRIDWHDLLGQLGDGVDVHNSHEVREKIRKVLAKEMAVHLNAYVAEADGDTRGYNEAIRDIARTLSHICEKEKEDDQTFVFLEQFARHVSDSSFFELLTIGFGPMRVPIFDYLLLSRVTSRKNLSLVQWLKEMDPDAQKVLDVMSALFSLNKTPLASGCADYFLLEGLEALTRTQDDLLEYAGVYVYFCERYLGRLTQDNKRLFAQKLFKAYAQPNLTPEQKGVLAFLIKTYSSKQRLSVYETDLATVSRDLPDVKKLNIPVSSWLADGVLSARLMYYYNPLDGKNPDKSDMVWWFQKDLEMFKTMQYELGPLVDDSATTSHVEVMANQGNVPVRILMTLQPVDAIKDDYARDEFDVMVQRGHGDSVKMLFDTKAGGTGADFKDKLLITGACRAVGDTLTDDVQKYFINNYFMGDLGEGKGFYNSLIPDQLFRAIMMGNDQWSALNEFRLEGFILPDHNIYRLAPYVFDYVKSR